MRGEPVRALIRLLRDVPRSQLIILSILTALCSLTEGIGIMLLPALLQATVGAPGSATGSAHSFYGPETSLGAALAVFVALIALRSLLQHAQLLASIRLQHQVVDGLRQRCFAVLLASEWRWLAQRRMSDHANLITTNIARIGLGLHTVLGLIANSVTVVVALLAMATLAWPMALGVIAGGVCLGVLASFGQRKRALRLGNDLGMASRAMQARLLDGLKGVRSIKIFGNEAREEFAFGNVLGDLRIQQQRFATAASLSRCVTQVSSAALLAALAYACLAWWRVPVETVLALAVVLARVVPLLGSFLQSYNTWLHTVPAVAETDRLIADCTAAAEPSAHLDAPRLALSVDIVLEAVSVTYAGRERPALDSASLRIPARATTAILGESGAGKSTLADVLTGLTKPDSGIMKVDGLVIAGETRRRWRRSVAYVEQEPYLFNDTIRNNLLWAKPTASETELERALTRAAAEFVARLPSGIDAVIGDDGVALSGGERQRIALARALLGEPELIILDEATSALDAENETAVRRSLDALRKQLTVVIISHRPTMLDAADHVVELAQGRVRSMSARSRSAA